MDLNADLAEGFPHDADLLAIVTSANVACGGHAGSRRDRVNALRVAGERGVVVGAHPGYPDRAGFGRRELGLSATEIRASVEAQVVKLGALAERHGFPGPRYLKPHGALYHRAAADEQVAAVLVRVARELGLGALLHAPGALTHRLAQAAGLAWYAEGFADRGYGPGGQPLARGLPGAVLRNESAVERQARALADTCDSLCVHGDGERAVELARAARAGVVSEGFTVKSFLA